MSPVETTVRTIRIDPVSDRSVRFAGIVRERHGPWAITSDPAAADLRVIDGVPAPVAGAAPAILTRCGR